MRKKRIPTGVMAIIFVLANGIFIIIVRIILFSPADQAKETVDEFYSHEQDANFSDSWELFHPYMKEKFNKASFVQDRSHVFIGHFGAESFSYTVGNSEKVKGWKAEKGSPSFKHAYKFQVIQSYKGKYGKFSFQQDVFVVEYKHEWRILWDYNQ
ncbi:hypothetical protein [Bacillus sp. T33-2]|uniref:hypothetical protein n=1 Tax=Bacillus sp. T33-2 TaxID=2054168 RepID=UPI000C78987D|nr:hypothetical protein [Bacillus sp. T33-2]PLR95867.1 hypothetical protein CVD19_12605 [Bacillus sp. T33-2]